MQLSKRESQLIDIFLKNGPTLTGSQLAEIANVSTKTIYRTIKKINEASDEGDIVISEISKGFTLDYDRYLNMNLIRERKKEIEPMERRNTVLLMLLFKSPNKSSLKKLYEKYYVSETVIANDVIRMGRLLKSYKLTIHRKKDACFINGKEADIRKAVNAIIDVSHFIDEHAFSTKDGLINAYDLDVITSQLELMERRLENPIPYPYNINIFSHLYILINRFREGKVLTEEESLDIDQDETVLIQKNQALYSLAEDVILRIGNYLHTALPSSEVFFLFQYLLSSRLKEHTAEVDKVSETAIRLTDYFLQQMSEQFTINLCKREIREDLLVHMTPLLYRNQNEITIKNGLLQDIVNEYPEIFRQLKEISASAAEVFGLHSFTDDELGFLVLYFAKYKEERNHQKRVIIMCSSGVGTSEFLKVKVKRAFPELEIVDVVSASRFKKDRQKYQNIDFIITTVNSVKDSGIPAILVNAVFTKQDQARLKALLEEM